MPMGLVSILNHEKFLKNGFQLVYDSTVTSKGKLSGSRSILKSIYFFQGVEKPGPLVAFLLVNLLI